MSEPAPQFELAKDIEHYLAALSKVYAQQGERQKQEIIVNSRVRILEEYSYDNWNGGTYGHALYLTVPEGLYIKLVKKRKEIQDEIREEINKLQNVQNEFIAEVFLEMEKVKDQDWRRKSGLLYSQQRVISRTSAERIWGKAGYRIFLSHKAEVKRKVATLKEGLAFFGACAFVAHTDIHPTKEWQDEIENALASMDAFVALLTEKFHESNWTDQEVGYALARGVPIIAVKLGMAPYGFIGRFQALSCEWDDAPLELVKLLIKQPRMLDSYIAAVPRCDNFEDGNTLSKLLPHIDELTPRQAEHLALAYNNNDQLRGSFGFSGERSWLYGDGLAAHLSRASGKKFVRMLQTGEIRQKGK